MKLQSEILLLALIICIVDAQPLRTPPSGSVRCGIFRDCLDEVDTTSAATNKEDSKRVFLRDFLHGLGRLGIIRNHDGDGSTSTGGSNRNKNLPEGGSLWTIRNRDDDTTILDKISTKISSLSSEGFLNHWVKSKQTCNVATAEPECLDLLGKPGFWICRTRTNPFTDEAESKTVCIGEANFVVGHDECGCCRPEADGAVNTHTAASGCPAPCGCTCNGGQGVWLTSGHDIDTGLPNRCVDKLAVSTIQIGHCLETCPEEYKI